MSNPVDAQPQDAFDILAGLNAEVNPTEPTDSEKLNYLYQTAVRVQKLIDQVTPEDMTKVQKTISNPLVRKMLGM